MFGTHSRARGRRTTRFRKHYKSHLVGCLGLLSFLSCADEEGCAVFLGCWDWGEYPSTSSQSIPSLRVFSVKMIQYFVWRVRRWDGSGLIGGLAISSKSELTETTNNIIYYLRHISSHTVTILMRVTSGYRPLQGY